MAKTTYYVETYIDTPGLSGWAPLPVWFETQEQAETCCKERFAKTGELTRITAKITS